MRKYYKTIIFSVIMIALIVLITLVLTTDTDLLFIKNLSIAGISNRKEEVEVLKAEQTIEENNYSVAKNNLENTKNNFDVQKEKYDTTEESTKQLVKDAIVDEQYFIEYLWIILGDYATINNLDLDVVTPGSYSEGLGINYANPDTTDLTMKNSDHTNPTRNEDRIKIVVTGRYANVADFVFDVENDKNLRFKLDNINMTYSGENEIEAVFDVLSFSVKR